ncbi:MAG: carboxypeptidase regulatory-like domain-containing protein, partial [Acidobacteriaceae bacterium]|nr:carboxypeptidase regulatory-like domain-containing protein [Acidobacteriaceae bacterium]
MQVSSLPYVLKRAGITCFILVLTLLLAPARSWAQSTGTIQGSITDPTGAAIPDAVITVTNQDTGEKRVIKSDSVGLYSVPSLPPGTYKLQVELHGFQTVVADN